MHTVIHELNDWQSYEEKSDIISYEILGFLKPTTLHSQNW